jgi:putative DNA primase/helicase
LGKRFGIKTKYGAQGAKKGAMTVDEGNLHRRCAGFPLTDLGNAERFTARNNGKFLWCPTLGWLFWDGKRWARDGADEKVKEAELKRS